MVDVVHGINIPEFYSCGAAPLSKEIEEAVKKRFNVPFIKTGYGMTETTLGVAFSPEVHKVGSVGTLLKGVKGNLKNLTPTHTHSDVQNNEMKILI